MLAGVLLCILNKAGNVASDLRTFINSAGLSVVDNQLDYGVRAFLEKLVCQMVFNLLG